SGYGNLGFKYNITECSNLGITGNFYPTYDIFNGKIGVTLLPSVSFETPNFTSGWNMYNLNRHELYITTNTQRVRNRFSLESDKNALEFAINSNITFLEDITLGVEGKYSIREKIGSWEGKGIAIFGPMELNIEITNIGNFEYNWNIDALYPIRYYKNKKNRITEQ
ncbi:MAG: hypothetical protein WC356_07560, partial [Candidatus Micrarchaeia archaeon]